MQLKPWKLMILMILDEVLNFFWLTLFWIFCIKGDFINMFLHCTIADSHKMCLPCFWTLSCLFRFRLHLLIDLPQCKCQMILSLFLMVFVFSSNVSTSSAGRKHVCNYVYKCNQKVKTLCFPHIRSCLATSLCCLYCTIKEQLSQLCTVLW